MAAAKKKTKYRQQASVESEVARSRLALAQHDETQGEKELAFRRSVEASFDAGVANGYATEAGQKTYTKECKAILADAQVLVARVAKGHKGKASCEAAYKAGVKYAKARAQNKNADVQAALAMYEGAIDEVGVGRITNPVRSKKPTTGASVGRLKAKLLR